MIRITLLFATISILSCSRQVAKVMRLAGEKDLIPEGITYEKGKIFISSVLKNKILQFDITNNVTSDFISTDQHGFRLGLGLFTKDNLLFALSNNANSKPSLFVFNIKEKSLIKVYNLVDDSTHLWNDMTIDDFNQIYITDTKQNKIYKIHYPNDEIKEYFSDSTIAVPNGIALSGNSNKLFIASDIHGVRILDMNTKKILNEISTDTKGIDGLKYYNGKLYAIKNGDKSHTNHGLYSITLTQNLDGIKNIKPILIGHNLLNVPTTFDIKGSYIYLLANSQMDNLNQETMKIIHKSDLTDTYILKIKVKNGG